MCTLASCTISLCLICKVTLVRASVDLTLGGKVALPSGDVCTGSNQLQYAVNSYATNSVFHSTMVHLKTFAAQESSLSAASADSFQSFTRDNPHYTGPLGDESSQTSSQFLRTPKPQDSIQ